MKKKIIFQTRPGIGDMCIFLTYIINIVKKNLDSEFYLVAKKRSFVDDILTGSNIIKKVIYVPESKSFFNQLLFFKNLKRYSFDAAYIYHYGLNYFLFCFFLGIKKIYFYGLLKRNENICIKAETQTKKWLKDENINFDFEFLKKENIKKENTITIGIGGSGKDKKWPIDNYILLIKKIYKIKNFNFLIAGGKEEVEDFKKIKRSLSNHNINLISLCEFTIKDAILEISRSKMYVGNDTGFMHIAGCLGIESYGIFGGTSINYCDYNENINPINIQPKNYCKSENVIKLISEDYVFSFLENKLNLI